MNELEIEFIKEKYVQYKKEHYEEEREMRKLLKMKKLIPEITTDDNWKRDYKTLNDSLSDGLYYYNELKNVLSEEQLNAFVEKVKFDVLKERYLKFGLDKLEDNLSTELDENKKLLEELSNEQQKVIPKVDFFDETLLAQSVLEEKELIQKVKIVRKYQNSTVDIFFDTTAVLKAELTRLVVDRMNLADIHKNELITACLVYTFKKIHSPKEIQRIKVEKEQDKNFLKTLGFDESFCKICSEYNRYNETEEYEREKEGDILELIDKFVGLIMHREDRLAFPVEEALDLLDTKLLADVNNRYKNQFMQCIASLEEIEVSRDVGIMTYLANTINKNPRQNLASILEAILKVRELLGGAIHEHKVMRLEKIEKVQDKLAILENLQKLIAKAKEKIMSMSKILKGYKRLSEGNQVDLDR